MASKKKTVSAVVAVALAAAILLGGTFAWQSISQEALNEVYGFVNPGGRLHDDFHEVTDPLVHETRTFDKDVYVENFTTVLEDGVQIFARVRLDEYMEIGAGAGTTGEGNKSKSVDTTNPNATFENMDEWRTRLPSDTDNPFQKYWDWTMAGQGEDGTLGVGEAEPVFYMPTFNKNKDSVEADVNGTFGGTDKNNTTPEDAFGDYVDYTPNAGKEEAKKGYEVYDADNNEGDELKTNPNVNINDVIEGGAAYLDSKWSTWATYVAVSDQKIDHHSKQTLKSKVITMEEWLEKPVKGDFWVWDEDGWAYWANPINPDSATGIFLDGIARTEEIINEEWYYGINVVAQFITADHLGRDTNDGFYSDMDETPSYNALKLLNAIGVEVNTTVEDIVKLDAALALGGNIALGDQPIAADSVVDADGVSTNFNWKGGGTLNGGRLNAYQNAYAGLLINAAGDGAVAATVNGTAVDADSNVTFAVYAKAAEKNVTLNNMTVTARVGGVLVDGGNAASAATVTLNDVSVTTSGGGDAPWKRSAVAASDGANVVINGGAYEGEHAIYVFDADSTVTVNDGTFKGALKVDGGTLVIKGGTFTADPSDYLAEDYRADWDEELSRWVVSKIVF